MSGQYPPLTCAQFKNVLTKMGFAFVSRRGLMSNGSAMSAGNSGR